jgi:formamidopyrimidine-DNA glycosylase
MPESPEVQALADALSERLSGRAIADVDVTEFRVVGTRERPPSSVLGARVRGVSRLGKHVDIALDEAHIVVTLGRHGWARWHDTPAAGEPAEAPPPTLATLTFDDATTVEWTDAGTWVSLRLAVVDDPREVPAVAKLGSDPAAATFTADDLDSVLIGRRKQLKAVLQEQESLAGIGNAYSDEILHAARLSPVVHAAALTAQERQRLFVAVTGVVRDAIEARRGIPIHQLKAAKTAAMRVHGRAGQACPVCGDEVRDVGFGGTTGQYCPTCQTAGTHL